MFKRLIALLAAAMLIFAFTGCGSSQEEAVEEAPAAAEEVTEEVPATEAEPAVEPAAEPAATDDIGIDKATEIALADAGLAASDVQFTKQSAEIDDGVNIYEVEFVSGNTEYEYDIDAKTGNILSRDTDNVND